MKRFRYESVLGSSEIFLGDLEWTKGLVEGLEGAPVITSIKIASLYPQLLSQKRYFLLPAAGEIKSLHHAEELYLQFLSWNLDRSSLVVGLGGGEVTDLVGFAASTFKRGLDFILIPTTLLAQVDAAIGGKTAVDLGGIKNVVGTFALPRAVLIDPKFLLDLPEEEILNGLAEVVKHGLIASVELFSFLEENWSALQKRDLVALERIIEESIRLKMEVVLADPRERGLRRILNFGHTFGHALEKSCRVSHGLAVVWGITIEVKLSILAGLLERREGQFILDFIYRVFPSVSSFPFSLEEWQKLWPLLAADKKWEGELINFVFLRRVGEPEIRQVSLAELKEWSHDLCKSGPNLF